ncbi:hypothetical protein Tco_0825621 [Tanacetum coccineum]
MSSDNASSAVTYMSISSYSNGPSWGIPLMNADELPKIDPYEEVAQQGQAPPLSPAYVPDPIELDEHVPPYVEDASPTAKLPGYIVDSDSMEEDNDEDSIDYPNEPEDDDEDPNEDDEEDLEEDLSEEHEPEDEDAKEEEPSEVVDMRWCLKRTRCCHTTTLDTHGARRCFQTSNTLGAFTQTQY